MAIAKTKTTRRASVRRVHFAIRAIRNANPRHFRSHKAGHVLARIFSL